MIDNCNCTAPLDIAITVCAPDVPLTDDKLVAVNIGDTPGYLDDKIAITGSEFIDVIHAIVPLEAGRLIDYTVEFDYDALLENADFIAKLQVKLGLV